MSATLVYWIAFLSYSAVVVAIGFNFWWKRRHLAVPEDTGAFWSANQTLSGWATGLSISASMMSISWSCVYGVQLFYWYGFGAVWLLLLPWLVTMGAFFVLASRFRRRRAFSQPELLERVFGTRSRQLLAPALIVVFIVWAGAEIFAAGLTIAPFLGIPVPATLALIAVVVAAYSFTGGFEAVVSTDKIQFTLVAGFIVIMAGIALSGWSGGGHEGAWWSGAVLAPRAAPDLPNLLSPGIALIAMTFVAYLPGWIVETDVWIRLQAARSDRAARVGVAVAALNSLLFVGVFPMVIGVTALALYPPVAGVIPERLAEGNLIFSTLMQDYSPEWLNLFLGIGLVAAAMSTVDTCGNVVALSASYDLLEPALRGRRSGAQLDRMARWISVAAIGAAFVYALFTESLWDIFYLSSGILTTTVFVPVMATFHKAATPRRVHRAIVLGFVGTLIAYALESRGLLAGIQPQWLSDTQVGYILYGLLLSLLGYGAGRR